MKRRPQGCLTLSWDGRVLNEHTNRKAAPGELWITWKPCVIGGPEVPTITGLNEKFLPRGVQFDLVKLTRKGDEWFARYRVQAPAC